MNVDGAAADGLDRQPVEFPDAGWAAVDIDVVFLGTNLRRA